MRDRAIRNSHSNVVSISDEIDAFDANGNVVNLDETLITAEVTRLQAIEDANEYARNRKVKYDALNQFELMTDDAANSTTTHADAIAAIKAEFPKP